MHTKSRSKLFAVSSSSLTTWRGVREVAPGVCMFLLQKALAEAKAFVETGKLPEDMDEKPPQPESQDESEGTEEVGNQHRCVGEGQGLRGHLPPLQEPPEEEVQKAPAKAGSKRKAPSKAGGRGNRKVKVVSDAEDASDSAPSKEKDEDEVHARSLDCD